MYRPSFVAAAAWTLVASAQARRLARHGRIVMGRVLPPPPLPLNAGRAVTAALTRTNATCLTRSLVLQAWHAAHDVDCDVVIGVRHEGPAVEAHAWLDGQSPEGDYVELARRPADAGRR